VAVALALLLVALVVLGREVPVG
jgi:hypothetical protein